MDIYIYLCYLFAFTALFELAIPIKVRKLLFLLNGLILLIVVGGRACGTDYWLYKNHVELGLQEESLWPPLFSICSIIFPFQLLIFLVAFFTIAPFYYLIYKKANGLYNLAAAFFFTEYFFMTLMQQARQGIALSAIAWCIIIFNSNKVKICLLSLVSAMIHFTGYFGLLIIVIKKNYYTLSNYIIVYGLSLLLGGLVFNLLLDNVPALGIKILTAKVVGYANRTDNLDATTPLFSFRFFLFFSMLYYCYRNRHRFKDPDIPYMCNILFGGICFYTLFNPIVDLAVRGSSCFILLYFFLILMVLGEKDIPNAQKNIIYWLSVCYCFYLMYGYMNMIIEQNDDLDLIPYQFF